VAPKAPPAAIEETPPKQRLQGANVAWVPGYWGWDDERNDFLWVSGIWRVLPPGRQWVSGYWGKSGQAFQWTSGYWANAKASEVEYLPEPPATVEAGPNVAASSADQTWLPGCWLWQKGRYVWRPGFWAAAQPDWNWVPAHYVWAPRGYVYVEGYWDYSLARRGVLFAPVYFNSDVYARPGFTYSPEVAIDLGMFANHLFLRPQYQHYYFGDYYASNYRDAGFLPRFSFQSSRFGYDPIYAHDRWQHRQDRGWEQRQQTDFENRRTREDLRPPRTWAGQGLQNASDATARVGLPGVASLLDNLGRDQDSRLRFEPVDQMERQRLARQAQDVQRFRQQRQTLEINAAAAPAETRTNEFTPARVRLPASPIVAKPGENFGKDQTPPKIYEVPQSDPQVAPKPRANRSAPQPQPKADRPASQPPTQSKVDRSPPQPRGNNTAGPKQEQHQNLPKDKGNDKN
jgi:hypothetical protein